MDELPTTDHADVAELLPDYALGSLDDVTVDRLERHLAGCPSCRREFADTLEVLGSLADVAPPRPEAKASLLARAGAASPRSLAVAAEEHPSLAAPTEAAPVAVAVPADSRRPWPLPARLDRRWLTAAAVLVALLVPLAGWNIELQRRLEEQDLIYSLVTNPAAAHPLDDSELPTDAAGVIFAVPARNEAYLVASGLPALPPDERYQIWLFTDDGQRISAGLFAVEPDGDGRTLLRTPEPFADYVAAAVSAEPQQGSPSPTSPLALGGWIGG